VSAADAMLYCPQPPQVLLECAETLQSDMSDEQFLSKGRDFEQKVQEAFPAAVFSCIFDTTVCPVRIRMAHQQVLDFELISNSNEVYKFEVVTAYEPGRKIRLEYRDSKKPAFPPRGLSGVPVPAEWVATTILNKTAKVEKKRLNRHLLVYQNISGGAADLKRLRKLVSGVESIWASVWIISGVPDWGGVALLCNTHGFNWSTMKWLSYVNAQEGMGFSGFDIYLQQGESIG